MKSFKLSLGCRTNPTGPNSTSLIAVISHKGKFQIRHHLAASLKPDTDRMKFYCSFLPAMEFHENLQDLAVKEGLKGRKLHKAVESFTWNITILKVRIFSTISATFREYFTII